MKLPYFLELFKKKCGRWSLGIDAGAVCILGFATRGPSYLVQKCVYSNHRRWFSFWSTVRGLAYRVALLRDVALGKLSYFLEFWNETWWEWSLGINAGTEYAFVPFRHQGAELFSAKGRKMRVLSIFRGF